MCHKTLKTKYKKLDQYIEFIENKEDDLAILKKAQEIFGYLSKEVQIYISEKLGISEARVRGIIKYNSLKENPTGKYNIKVCLGTTCCKNGVNEILEEFEKILNIKSGEITKDGKFTIDTTGCTSVCTKAPIININGKIYSNITRDDVKNIIKEYK